MNENIAMVLRDAKAFADRNLSQKTGIVVVVGSRTEDMVLAFNNTAGLAIAALKICEEIERSHVFGQCKHCDKAAHLALRAARTLAAMTKDDCRW